MEGRFVPQGSTYMLEILIGKRWVKVPKDRILRLPSRTAGSTRATVIRLPS